jgi:hypothetical protein
MPVCTHFQQSSPYGGADNRQALIDAAQHGHQSLQRYAAFNQRSCNRPSHWSGLARSRRENNGPQAWALASRTKICNISNMGREKSRCAVRRSTISMHTEEFADIYPHRSRIKRSFLKKQSFIHFEFNTSSTSTSFGQGKLACSVSQPSRTQEKRKLVIKF